MLVAGTQVTRGWRKDKGLGVRQLGDFPHFFLSQLPTTPTDHGHEPRVGAAAGGAEPFGHRTAAERPHHPAGGGPGPGARYTWCLQVSEHKPGARVTGP